jgi:hypothetical protein
MAELEELTKEAIDILLDKAVDLFNDGMYPECEAAIRAVLEHSISRWQKMYAIALLADCLDDWYDAEVSQTRPSRAQKSVTPTQSPDHTP